MEKKERINYFEFEYAKMLYNEIHICMNKLLPTYHNFHHKLKNFLWNLAGRASINLQTLFKASIDSSFRCMDELSERSRTFNQIPGGKLYELIKTSEKKR